jgi:hypothetical protein
MGDLNANQMLQIMMQLDPFTWVIENKLRLSHGPWRLEGHEYQVAWLQEQAREQVFIKGAQIGATEVLVLRTLHGMIYERYPQGALYLFPTRDDVRDFSKARFDPLISNNNFIGAHVQSTDAQNIKKIGPGHLYLRGARSTKSIGTKKSSSQLKSIPVDRIVFDEMDEIEPSMIDLARERVSHSSVKEQMFLGTPTIPDYGVDKMYQQSDQRVWMVRCEHCNRSASLDLEFPNCLQRQDDGTVLRVCVHCGKEINPRLGEWVAQYENRSLVGWWISQLNSTYIDPTTILNLYEDPPYGDLSEVMNSKLGRAYIPAENRLNESDVYSCCGNDPMMTKHEGPTCMGVDVGQNLNVVIAERPTRNSLRVVRVCRVTSFNDLHDLARDFNVKSAVIDIKPETRKVREFQRSETFSVFACDYVETKTSMTYWDEKDKVIKCNRTEICDATHELVTQQGRLVLPRRNEELSVFAKQMCHMAKVIEEDPDTGARVARYKGKIGGPDDYRHAMNYCFLASERIGIVSDRNLISKFFNSRRRRTWMTS